jgi:division protein CdvB (Snf7/Vps24/ESCRT-III family)
MADPVTEFQAIVRQRDKALAQLAAAEAPALKRANQLVNKKNRGETLTADEKEELKNMRARLDEVHHAMWIVGQISLQAMNDSALLRDIRNSLEGVSDDLIKAKAKLKKIGEVATAFAAAAEGLAILAKELPKPIPV